MHQHVVVLLLLVLLLCPLQTGSLPILLPLLLCLRRGQGMLVQ